MREKQYRKVLSLSDELLCRVTTAEEMLCAARLLLLPDASEHAIEFEQEQVCGGLLLSCVDWKAGIALSACVPADEREDADLYITDLSTGKLQMIMPYRTLRALSVDVGHTLLAAKSLCGKRIRHLGFLSANSRLLAHISAFEAVFSLTCINVLCRNHTQREQCLTRLSDQVESPVYFYETPKALAEASDLILCSDDGSSPVIMPEWLQQQTLVIDYTGGANLPVDLLRSPGQLIVGSKAELQRLLHNGRLTHMVSEQPSACSLAEALVGQAQPGAAPPYRIYAHADQGDAALALASILYSLLGRREKRSAPIYTQT